MIYLRMRKTSKAKTPPGDFKVTTPKNPLYYHNKQLLVKESQYLIPTYSWTLTPIHNWTCSVVTISPFQCNTPSTWLTNRCKDPSTWLATNLRKMLAAKFFSSSVHQHDEDQETPWLENPTAYKHNSFSKRKMN